MTNNYLTPAEALRALADGKTLISIDSATCKLENDSIIARDEDGELLEAFSVCMAGWHSLPKKRDIGADPRVGDVVIVPSGVRVTVLYVDARYVLSAWQGDNDRFPWAHTRAGWIGLCKEAGLVERVEEKSQ